jgi:hypothetical protein
MLGEKPGQHVTSSALPAPKLTVPISSRHLSSFICIFKLQPLPLLHIKPHAPSNARGLADSQIILTRSPTPKPQWKSIRSNDAFGLVAKSNSMLPHWALRTTTPRIKSWGNRLGSLKALKCFKKFLKVKPSVHEFRQNGLSSQLWQVSCL